MSLFSLLYHNPHPRTSTRPDSNRPYSTRPASPLPRARPTLYGHPPRGHPARPQDPVQPQGLVDSDDPAHLSRHVPSAPLRDHELGLVRPSLLDEGHPRFQQGYLDGIGNHAGLDQWDDHAVVGRGAIGRGGFLAQGG